MLKPEWIEDVRAFLQHAGALEQEMTAAANSVRAESEKGIDQDLIAARSRLLGTLKYLHQEFAIPAGDRPLGEKERLILLVSFVQGARYVEAMIAEGQYLKSCAVLRQDYEFLTRTRELRLARQTPTCVQTSGTLPKDRSGSTVNCRKSSIRRHQLC